MDKVAILRLGRGQRDMFQIAQRYIAYSNTTVLEFDVDGDKVADATLYMQFAGPWSWSLIL